MAITLKSTVATVASLGDVSSPVQGLVVYHTGDGTGNGTVRCYDGAAWHRLTPAFVANQTERAALTNNSPGDVLHQDDTNALMIFTVTNGWQNLP